MIYLFLLSRVLFGGFFIMNGINHFRRAEAMTQYSTFKKVPAPKLAVLGSGALILLSGLSIVLGLYPNLGAWGIILFLAPTTLMMHNFWTETDPNQKMNSYINFTKNVALIGGALAYLFIATPWVMSLTF